MENFKLYLFDYADVISLPQDQLCFSEMAKLIGLGEKDFHREYWKFRRAYDLGQRAADYWPRVAGRKLDAKFIEKLVDWDCRGWGRINPRSISFLENLKAEGKRLAVLSNLPIELVHYLRKTYSFLSLFDRTFFSAEIHQVKPDRESYQYVLEKTELSAGEIIFFDDKEENLKAASDLGMATFLVTQKSLFEGTELAS